MPTSIFGSRMLAVYNSAVESGCLNEFVTAVANDLRSYTATPNVALKDYPGVSLPAVNAAPLALLLATKEPGQSKLPGKTLIVQGSADTTVLPASTNRLLATMKAKGSDVVLSYQDNPAATHSGVLAIAAAQADISQHLRAVFAPPGVGGASAAP